LQQNGTCTIRAPERLEQTARAVSVSLARLFQLVIVARGAAALAPPWVSMLRARTLPRASGRGQRPRRELMTQYRVPLDAFAEARRTWDDLVALQPDVQSASGTLTAADLDELRRRVDAHREAMDVLRDALDTGEPDTSPHVAPARTPLGSAPDD
jgi:hypothetical protein